MWPIKGLNNNPLNSIGEFILSNIMYWVECQCLKTHINPHFWCNFIHMNIEVSYFLKCTRIMNISHSYSDGKFLIGMCRSSSLTYLQVGSVWKLLMQPSRSSCAKVTVSWIRCALDRSRSTRCGTTSIGSRHRKRRA